MNDKKLEPMVPCELRDGDKVQLGVATSPSVPPEFVYQYYTAMKVKRPRPEDKVDGSVKRLKTRDSQVCLF